MALKRNERYPGRYSNPTTTHPQGAFKNRTAPSAQDGSYLEQDWVNDWDGFFGRLLTLAGITPNGNVDTALASQYYDAMSELFLTKSNNLSEIAASGAASQSTARGNLGISIREVTFQSSGSWTAPLDVTTIYVDATAGGGGGGFGINATAGGGGGGGGAGVKFQSYTVVPGQTYSITVGLGGTGATTSSVNGTQGGTTSIGELVTLTGGGGGLTNGVPGSSGGAGGQPGLGGKSNASPSLSFGGAGGGSLFGSGGQPGLLRNTGSTPGQFGGGGGGGAGGEAGANGANGFVTIRW